jgi:hypothetical protein
MTVLIAIVAGLFVLDLIGGAHGHRRHYRRPGVHPNLFVALRCPASVSRVRGNRTHGSMRRGLETEHPAMVMQ